MAAQYDLTSKMIPFLDLHLVFPLLEFLEINEVKTTCLWPPKGGNEGRNSPLIIFFSSAQQQQQ
jgi:hypothetical protein